MTEAIVKVRAKLRRHYIQNNRLTAKFVDTLENFIRGPETDPRKETYGLPADAFGGGVTEDGEVKIRCRLRGRIKRDELRFAFYRANEVKVRVKDKQQTMYDILSGTPCREIF